jgi:hypothetical protein
MNIISGNSGPLGIVGERSKTCKKETMRKLNNNNEGGRKSMYSLNKVVSFINKHNKLNLKPEEAISITKELVKAGFSENITKSQIPLIKTAVEHISSIRKRHNPLKVCANVEKQSCPLCSTIASAQQLADVVLAGNRPAKYCMEHSVTLPIRSEK